MTPRLRAILSLCGDEDEATASLTLARLKANGLGEVEECLAMAEGAARERLAAAAWELRLPSHIEHLEKLLPSLDTMASLEEFCWAVARIGNATERVDDARAQLDIWARVLRTRLVGSRGGNETKLGHLRHVLGVEAGLCGDSETYSSPGNSFLDEVIFRRRGLPISLALVYMFVGARVGIPVDGVSAPGHFLAKIGETYFDPFNAGEQIPKEALALLLAIESSEQKSVLLEAAPFPSIARRMLRNLRSMDSDPRRLPVWDRLLQLF